MKVNNKSKFGVINLISLCIIVLVLSMVPAINVIAEAENKLQKNFFGEVSSLQGVLEVWNIDTFEGGSYSKESFLLDVSKSFQSIHKGTYVVVKNLSVSELNLELGAGKFPDIFSFGFGLGAVIKNQLMEMDFQDKSFNNNIWISGFDNDQQLAVPYLMGTYLLFSTEESLTNANINIENVNLSEHVNDAGYITKLKKSEKKVYSTTYGVNEFVSPILSLSTENILSTNVHSIENNYLAYQNFVSNNSSTILLGTQRDLARFENKVKLGQLENFICQNFSSYSDLIQYFGICKQTTKLKQDYAKIFIEYAFTSEMQELVLNIGLLPVIDLHNDKFMNKSPILHNQFTKFKSKIVVPKLFT